MRSQPPVGRRPTVGGGWCSRSDGFPPSVMTEPSNRPPFLSIRLISHGLARPSSVRFCVPCGFVCVLQDAVGPFAGARDTRKEEK